MEQSNPESNFSASHQSKSSQIGILDGFIFAQKSDPILEQSFTHSLYMIGANGSVRGKKEFEPSSLAPESEPLLGPHLEDYWSIEV